MNYLELSIPQVEQECAKLHKQIIKDFDYDLVIFIAKGAYLIGDNLAKLQSTPLLEITASRKGSKLKGLLSPFASRIPQSIRKKLRKSEMEKGVYAKDPERNISYDATKYQQHENATKILLVDDSIDSGLSIIAAKNKLEQLFPNAIIKTVVFNTMQKAAIRPDFNLCEDTMICGPWSSDSKEYKTARQSYNVWKESQE